MHRKTASRTIASLLVIALLLVSGFASAAVDIFMRADDIKGDSVDNTFRGQIDLMSVQLGEKQSAVVGSAGVGAGKAQFEDLTITKSADRSSPILAGMVASGKVIRNVVISVRKAGATPIVVSEFTLTNAIVSGYTYSASTGAALGTETITLRFAQIRIAYTPTNATGGKEAPVVTGWDIVQNKAI